MESKVSSGKGYSKALLGFLGLLVQRTRTEKQKKMNQTLIHIIRSGWIGDFLTVGEALKRQPSPEYLLNCSRLDSDTCAPQKKKSYLRVMLV